MFAQEMKPCKCQIGEIAIQSELDFVSKPTVKGKHWCFHEHFSLKWHCIQIFLLKWKNITTDILIRERFLP